MAKGISIHRMKRTEQVYTFRQKSTGEVFHFAVDQLNAYLKGRRFEPENIIFHKDLVEHLIQQGGAEVPHMQSLPEEALEVPGTMLDFGDGTHVLADGVHRALRRFARGDATFPAYMVPRRTWERFLIIDFPDWAVDWEDYFNNGGDRTSGPKPFWIL